MDRNDKSKRLKTEKRKVALRKESVDRNFVFLLLAVFVIVALRKESVDRNEIRITPIDGIIESLSARRAWIEILFRGC